MSDCSRRRALLYLFLLANAGPGGVAGGQDLEQVPPAEWLESLEALRDRTPYPVVAIFVGGCPADIPWRARVRDAFLEARFDSYETNLLLAQMLAVGLDSCQDQRVLAWLMEVVETLARTDDPSIGVYLSFLRDHAAIRDHPRLLQLVVDPSVAQDVRGHIARTIEWRMTPLERERFLLETLGTGVAPAEWAQGAAVRLLGERTDAFISALAASIRSAPDTFEPTVVGAVIYALERVSASRTATRDLDAALAVVVGASVANQEIRDQARALRERLAALG